MNRVLLIIGGLLVGLLAALFTVPMLVDWTRYRGSFEEEATRLLGRDVRVGGRVNLRLLPAPYVRAEKVRIADTTATVGEPLFRAESFTIWLSVLPLLRGELQASQIDLRRPVVTLVLDEKGGGNWASLPGAPARSGFAPASVTLDHVRVTNGTLAIYGANGEARTSIEHVNGEFSAQALDGPYRFNAAFAVGSSPGELRLSTAKADPDGSVRFKGVLRTPLSGSSFVLDGKAEDIFGRLRVMGELGARLPLVPPEGGEAVKQASRGGDAYDVKAQLKADTSGAEISDLALSFEQDGKPQLAVGSARIQWQRDMVASAELSSRWIDVDRVAGRTARMGLAEQLQWLAQAANNTIPAKGQTSLKLALDQATLGGEIVSGLALSLERREGVLHLQTSAALPGASRIQATGTLTPANPEAMFRGEVSLRGASLLRLNAWAGRNTPLAAFRQDGPFVASGRLTLAPDRAIGRDLQVQVAGTSLSGEASFAAGPAGREIVLLLDGPELDVTPHIGESAGPSAVLKALAAYLTSPQVAGSAGTAATQLATLATNVSARLRIGRVRAGASSLRDVSADLTLAGGNLTVPAIRVGADEGWSLELRGDIAGLAKADSRGSLAFLASAETAAGLKGLLELADAPPQWHPAARREELLLPLRLAGRLSLGDAQPGSRDLSFDGVLAQSRVSGTARIEAKGDSWRDHRIDLALSLDGADAARLVELASPGTLGAGGAAAGSRTPGRLSLRGIGTARTGLVSLASFDAQALTGEYRGRLVVNDDATVAVDGNVRVVSTDAGAALAMFGVRPRVALAGRPAAGTIIVRGGGNKLALESQRVLLGEFAVAGKLDLEFRPAANPAKPGEEAAPVAVSGQLKADVASLPAILSLVSLPATQPRAQSALAAPPAWSEDPLDLSALANVDIDVRIEAGQIHIAPQIDLGRTTLAARHKAGRLDLQLADTAALGGKLKASLSLNRARAGVEARLAADLTGARIDAFAIQGAPPAATGGLGLKVDAEAAGLSLRGLAAGLRGKGELSLAKASLGRLNPGAIGAASEAVMAIKGEVPAGELRRRLEPLLAAGPVPVGDRKLPLEIADGIVKLAALAIEGAEGRLTGATSIDLEAMRIDSEWRIEAAPVPPVTTVRCLTTSIDSTPAATQPTLTAVLSVKRPI